MHVTRPILSLTLVVAIVSPVHAGTADLTLPAGGRPRPPPNVDPDSSYGQGSGWVGGPGLKEKAPDIVRARQQAFAGFGPGVRSGNGGERLVAPPRVNVPGSLVGQPDPTNPRGGNGPGYQGYNPNDFVRPPRPS